MKTYDWKNYPVDDVRRFLEPGPIVLVSSAWRGERNIMTMGWHTVMEFAPSLVGCIISNRNHSFGMIRKSRECAIHVPTADLAETVVRIGNCSGASMDKFSAFGLTARRAEKIKAPLIGECWASFECRLHDSRLVERYNFFIFKVVRAHVAKHPRVPRTIHYRGDGEFMLAGPETRKYRRLFRPDYL